MRHIFIGQAEVNRIDACGLHHERDKYAGRGQRPWLASTSATAPSPPRPPRVKRASTWCRAIAICLRDAAQIERPLTRLGALRALRKLVSRPPSELSELQRAIHVIATGASSFSLSQLD
eukprot:9503172-Pyramimonas_sp.AAC.1